MLNDLDAYAVSFNGEKLFYIQQRSLVHHRCFRPQARRIARGKPVNNRGMFATIDPRAEFAQMYRETWHIERDFFYDPHLHGLDLAKIEAKYQPYSSGLASRAEFTYLCEEMLGEIEIGHMFIGGPHVCCRWPEDWLAGRRLHC